MATGLLKITRKRSLKLNCIKTILHGLVTYLLNLRNKCIEGKNKRKQKLIHSCTIIMIYYFCFSIKISLKKALLVSESFYSSIINISNTIKLDISITLGHILQVINGLYIWHSLWHTIYNVHKCDSLIPTS